jgi:hypothetical protein
LQGLPEGCFVCSVSLSPAPFLAPSLAVRLAAAAPLPFFPPVTCAPFPFSRIAVTVSWLYMGAVVDFRTPRVSLSFFGFRM